MSALAAATSYYGIKPTATTISA